MTTEEIIIYIFCYVDDNLVLCHIYCDKFVVATLVA
jgi:hypothetical protein